MLPHGTVLDFRSHRPVILVTDGVSGIKHKRIVPLEWTDHLTGKSPPVEVRETERDYESQAQTY